MILFLLDFELNFYVDMITSIGVLVDPPYLWHKLFLFSSLLWISWLTRMNWFVNLKLQAGFIVQNPVRTYSGLPPKPSHIQRYVPKKMVSGTCLWLLDPLLPGNGLFQTWDVCSLCVLTYQVFHRSAAGAQRESCNLEEY